MKKICKLLCLAIIPLTATSQQSPTERFARFLTPQQHYVCQRTIGHITIDGKLDEPEWQKAQAITYFVDISGEDFPTPRYETEAKMVWDDDYLYVAAKLKEPHVWADITKRDEIVYKNNDFEVFIDSDGDGQNYFEIETNAIGTVFDLSIVRPYRSPGGTFVQFQWNCPNLQLQTQIDGTLNDANDTDKGWTVEMAIPKKAIANDFDETLVAGRTLRIGFSRVEWQYELDSNGKYSCKRGKDGKILPEDNWTWGATGQIAMHMPERWGYVRLSPTLCGQTAEPYQAPTNEAEQRLLWAMFYAQEENMNKTKKYLSTVNDFHLTETDLAVLPAGSQLCVETTKRTFELSILYKDGTSLVLDEQGRLYLNK